MQEWKKETKEIAENDTMEEIIEEPWNKQHISCFHRTKEMKEMKERKNERKEGNVFLIILPSLALREALDLPRCLE